MPRVEYTKAKGLVQSTGSGFALNEIETTSGHLALTQGTTYCEITGAHQVTLPAVATANTGDVVILSMSAAANGKIMTTGKAGGTVTFNAKGDGAICVFNGTQWVCLIHN